MSKDSHEVSARVDSTLSKGLQVLEALAGAENGRGVTELARELELTKSNTFRLLRTLTALGYARPTDDRRYRVTMKVWQLAREVEDNLNLRALAAPLMGALSRDFGEAVYLAVPDGLSVVYIDKVESTQPIRSWNPVGGRAPLHCVGTGKALLCADYARLRERMRGNLTRYTDRTITTLARLDRDMAEVASRGYAIDTGEYRDRVCSFGAAVSTPDGRPVAAIGVSVPDVNLTARRVEEVCLGVKDAAASMSAAVAGS